MASRVDVGSGHGDESMVPTVLDDLYLLLLLIYEHEQKAYGQQSGCGQ